MLKFEKKYYCLYGLELLIKYLANMKKEIAGVIAASDIENIHRMRVSSRRFRAAINSFRDCLPKKTVKLYKKWIKKTTKALGTARDLDIQIAYINNLLKKPEPPQNSTGLNRIFLRLKQKRKFEQNKVIKLMSEFKKKKLFEKFETSIRNVTINISNSPEKSELLFKKAFEDTNLIIKDINKLKDFILLPSNTKELHQLRIKFKNLRYTLGLFTSIYKKEVKKLINKIKVIQDFLGEIHDCDIWIEYINKFEKDERKRHIEFYGNLKDFSKIKKGILYLKKLKSEERNKFYKDFITLWKKYESEKFIPSVQETLGNYILKAENSTTKKSDPE